MALQLVNEIGLKLAGSFLSPSLYINLISLSHHLAVGSGSSRSDRQNNVAKKECVEGSRSNIPYINSLGPGDDVAFF
jgi:hypothetical protein